MSAALQYLGHNWYLVVVFYGLFVVPLPTSWLFRKKTKSMRNYVLFDFLASVALFTAVLAIPLLPWWPYDYGWLPVLILVPYFILRRFAMRDFTRTSKLPRTMKTEFRKRMPLLDSSGSMLSKWAFRSHAIDALNCGGVKVCAGNYAA